MKIAEIRPCKKCGVDYFYNVERGEGHCENCQVEQANEESVSN